MEGYRYTRSMTSTFSSTLIGVCWGGGAGGGWVEDTDPLLLCFWASFDSGKASSTKSHREQILDPLSNTLINLQNPK